MRPSIRSGARLILIALALSPAAAQQLPLDNGSEAYFQQIDARLFVDSLPPRLDQPPGGPPRLEDLLALPPLYTEKRENLFQARFDGYNLEANPLRFVYLQPERLDLVDDGEGGQALRIRTEQPVLAGVTRPLDPTRLAGRRIELAARVRLDGPYRQEPEAQSWERPVIQLRWERPHPDQERQLAGETLREWHTIFETERGTRPPPEFLPDGLFHTYRCRLTAPEDLLGATLQVVVQNCRATLVVDDLSLSLVETREGRLLREMTTRTGNLIGPGASFELGPGRAVVFGERVLSPLSGGPIGRCRGTTTVVETDAPDGRRALLMSCPGGRATSLELPWCGLAAGQPYTFSLWLRAEREGVKAAFGVADPRWQALGTQVTLTGQWQRYAAVFTAPKVHRQAFWPWLTISPERDTRVQVDGLQLEPGSAPTRFTPPALDLSVDTDQPLSPGLRNVALPDEPVTVTARLLQRSGEARRYRLRGVVEGHGGRLFRALSEVPAELELPTGEAVSVPLAAGPLPRGYYRWWLTATDLASGEVTRDECLLAVLPRPAASRFGFHDSGGENRGPVAQAAVRLGFGWFDTSETPAADWREHWTGDSHHEWSLLDGEIDTFSGAGVGVVYTLGPRLDEWPEWVTQRYGAQFMPSVRGEARLLPPAKLWAAYVRDVATRMTGKVAAYQVLTDVDQVLEPDEYLALVKVAREVIAAVDPAAQVVGPGVALAGSALPGGFLERVLEAGGDRLLDAVTGHFPARYPEELDAVRDGLRRLHERYGLPFWELGHGYAEAPAASYRLNPRAGLERASAPLTEQTYDGAAWAARHELLLAAAGVTRSFLSASVAEVEFSHQPIGPLIEPDGAPRSSLAALAVLADELGDGQPSGEWRWDFTLPGPPAAYEYRRPQGLRAVAFGQGERCLVALWTYQLGATVTVELPPAAAARAFVTTGEAVVVPADGKLLITHSPLYLADLPRSATAALDALTVAGVRPRYLPPARPRPRSALRAAVATAPLPWAFRPRSGIAFP